MRANRFGVLVLGALVLWAPAATADDAPSVAVTVAPQIVRGATGPEEIKGVVPAGGSVSWIVRWAPDGPCAASSFDDTNLRVGTDEEDFFGDGEHDNLPAGAFDYAVTAKAKTFIRTGDYLLCAWVQDDQRNTVAAASASTTVVRPQLSLRVMPPGSPRKGLKLPFVASGHVDTAGALTADIVPSRIVVCNDAETVCRYKPVHGCPATLAGFGRLQDSTSTAFGKPFPSYEGGHRAVHGDFHLTSRLRATTTGTFYFCGYMVEAANGAPEGDLATTTSFATFHVRR